MATTVSAGSSATFEVGPYDTITLTDSNAIGTLVLTSQTPKIVSDQTLAVQNGTFGPWRAPMSVVLTVTQGSADYTVNAKSLTVAQVAAAQLLVSKFGMPRAARKGQVLTDFATLSQWTVATSSPVKSADTTNTRTGTAGMSITPTSTFCTATKTFATATRISVGTTIMLSVYIPPASYSASMYFRIGFTSDAGSNFTNSRLEYVWLTPNHSQRDGWHNFTVVAGETGQGDYNAAGWGKGSATQVDSWDSYFTAIQITVQNASGVAITLDGVHVNYRDKPRLVLTFDGVGGGTVLSTIAPALAQYGWSAGIAVDGDNLAGSVSTLRTLRDTYGWTVGTQGIGHIDYSASPSSLSGDFDTAAAIHVANGFEYPKWFAYPSNAATPTTDATLVTKGCVWRRGGNSDLLVQNGYGLPASANGLVRSGNKQLLASNLTDIQKRVRQCADIGGLLSIFTHNASPYSADMSLGVDVGQWYAFVDFLHEVSRESGLEVLEPIQAAAALSSTTFA